MPQASPAPPHTNEITSGPVRSVVLRLAWPVLVGEALHTLFHIVDIAWVGRLGAHATAAISSGMFVLWTVFSIANLVAVGMATHVSRAIGGGDRRGAGRVVSQALLLSFAAGLAVAAAGWLASDALFVAIGATEAVRRAGRSYLAIYMAGAPLSFLYTTCAAAMRAAGDTRTPTRVTAWALLANALIDPLLIYGWGPFPRWEVAGAAVATVLCQAAAAAAFLRLAARGHPALPLATGGLRGADPRLMLSIARIGGPYSLVGILFSLNYLIFTKLAASAGEVGAAVIGIANRLESITYLGADAFAVAASTLVGQNLGAGRADRAGRGAWIATALMSLIAAALTVVMLLAPTALFRVFTSDPRVLEAGAVYLRILALCQIATAVEGVLGGAFAGAGDTLPPMTIHVAFGLGRPLLAVWLSAGVGLGLSGIAWTISGTCILRAICLAGIFLRGGWRSYRLPGAPPAQFPAEDAPDLVV